MENVIKNKKNKHNFPQKIQFSGFFRKRVEQKQNKHISFVLFWLQVFCFVLFFRMIKLFGLFLFSTHEPKHF